MSQPDFDVIVVGELNADLILTGDVIPAFGQAEKLIDDATLTLGSSSAIFACGAARLGLRVAFIGKVGDDEFGRFVIAQLQARHVDTSGVIVDPSIKTGLSVILSQPHDRAILTHLGSIAALRYAEIDQRLLARGRHLHLGSYFLLDALRPAIPALFAAAHRHGLTTSLDTNYDPAAVWDGGLHDVLAHTDLFLPNETELRAIAHLDDIPSALAALATDSRLVAAKLGPDGALVYSKGQIFRSPSVAVDVVDTTGAGDSFDAGFIYGHLAGWPVAQTVRFACICGALSTRAAGGTRAQATLAEALAMDVAIEE
ncbi:MAG: carbohydrate kinase family protein [Caldilineaceae bacterium]|nr:carbohydrate kinase family protein [Caldilineaceae bacterium]